MRFVIRYIMWYFGVRLRKRSRGYDTSISKILNYNVIRKTSGTYLQTTNSYQFVSKAWTVSVAMQSQPSTYWADQIYHDLDHLDPNLPFWNVVQDLCSTGQPRKRVLHHTYSTAPARQHELDHAGQGICRTCLVMKSESIVSPRCETVKRVRTLSIHYATKSERVTVSSFDIIIGF